MHKLLFITTICMMTYPAIANATEQIPEYSYIEIPGLSATNIRLQNPHRVIQINPESEGLTDKSSQFGSTAGEGNLAGVNTTRRPLDGSQGDPFFLNPTERYTEVAPFDLYLPTLNKLVQLNTTAPDKAAYYTIAASRPIKEFDYLGYYRKAPKPKQTFISKLFQVPPKETTPQKTEPTFGKNVSVYTSDPNDPTTYGRKIRVEYPKDWLTKPAVGPHILQKFRDTKYISQSKGRNCLIAVADVGKNFSPEQWKFDLSDPDTAQELFGAHSTVLHYKATQADLLPAMMLETETVQEQIGFQKYSKMLILTVGYKNTLILLQCMTIADDKTTTDDFFKESKNTFLRFMNSFKCLDRWENPDDSDYTSEYSN